LSLAFGSVAGNDGTWGWGGRTATTKALVLAGGGVTGIAWELGVIAGLADDGLELTDADLIVGTSAGATVAAQITTGSVDELVRAPRRRISRSWPRSSTSTSWPRSSPS
jgi:predicted acylesterase/phospholipase RssA